MGGLVQYFRNGTWYGTELVHEFDQRFKTNFKNFEIYFLCLEKLKGENGRGGV